MAKASQAFDRKTLDLDKPKEETVTGEAIPISDRLKPDSTLHGKLIVELDEMIRASERHIRQRYDDWDRVDEQCRLYLDLERAKVQGDGSLDTTKKNMPYKDSICMPLIYTTIMTRVAVLFSQLTSRYPRAHLEPRESGDFEGARVHEALIQYDLEQCGFDLQVWQGLYDSERYGMAVWYDSWEELKGKPARTGMSPLEAMLRGAPVAKDWSTIKEWCNITTIDPRDFRPDPNVPITQVQDGNFVGHKDYANILWYLERQLSKKEGGFFNLEEARKMAGSGLNERNSDGRWMQGTYTDNSKITYPNIPVVHLQWKIIPSEFGLSDVDHPEIWWFSVVDGLGAGNMIIRAHPSVYDHGKFTYSVSQPDRDAHAPFVPGMGQQLMGLQDTANWLVNSHIVNARKVINDQVIYNDDLIDSVDMSNPGPAKHIRLTRRGKRLHEMGQLRIADMYGQFQIQDITKSHLDTMQFLFPQAQRMAATPDTIQGMPLPSKRTLGEVEQVSQSATLRLGQDAVLLDRQLIGPTIDRCVMNRQQFSSMDVVVRLAGRLLQQMQKATGKPVEMLEISPTDLAGQYDYIVHSPGMAPDPARQTAIWGQLLQVLAQAPQLLNPDPVTGEALDPIAVFDEFVKSAGIQYLDRFKKIVQPQPGAPGPGQVAPDGPGQSGMPGVKDQNQIEKSVQAGNMLPI